MSKTVWKKGAFWALPMPDGSFGFCRLMTFPYAEFLEFNAREAHVDASVLDASGVLFAIAVHRDSLRRWADTKVQTRLPTTDELPIVFMQNVTDLNQCSIRGPDGDMRAASPAECLGLERSAVWSAVEIEARLWDAYKGRANAHVVGMRVKLPEATNE